MADLRDETGMERMKRRIREDPLTPIGTWTFLDQARS